MGFLPFLGRGKKSSKPSVPFSQTTTSSSGSAPKRGVGYILLNILRGINILCFAMIAASAVVFMIVSKLPNALVFFADVGRGAIVAVCVLLIMSETSTFEDFFEKNFPVVGPHRGFTWLGTSLIALGTQTLGTLSDGKSYSLAKMTLPLWRLCMGGGILAIVFGAANVVASFVFRTKDLTARDVRRNGTAPKSKTDTSQISYPQRQPSTSTQPPRVSFQHAEVRDSFRPGPEADFPQHPGGNFF